MDLFEKVGFACLGVVVVCYVVAMLVGLFSFWPYGLVGLVGVLGMGVLLLKVLKERAASEEDAYYSKSVEK